MATRRPAAPASRRPPIPILLSAGPLGAAAMLGLAPADTAPLSWLPVLGLAAALWALWVAARARAVACRLTDAPRPAQCPQRRGLLLSRHVRRPIVTMDPARLLLARFAEQVAAWPAVRVEDKIDRLQRVALACRAAGMGLAALSAASLLASLAG